MDGADNCLVKRCSFLCSENDGRAIGFCLVYQCMLTARLCSWWMQSTGGWQVCRPSARHVWFTHATTITFILLCIMFCVSMLVTKETNCLWILYEVKTSTDVPCHFLKSSEDSKNKYTNIIWTFLEITNLTHFFIYLFIYFISLHVSSITVLIIRRSNFINTSSGMISLCKWLFGMPARRFSSTSRMDVLESCHQTCITYTSAECTVDNSWWMGRGTARHM